MIKIEYPSVPQEYLDYIDHFKGKIKKWYDAGEMGNKAGKISLCDECKLLFRFLLKSDNLKKLLLLTADQLPVLINETERHFPVLKNDRINRPKTRSNLYLCLNKAFYSLGYCEPLFPDFKLTQALGLKACPYCNEEEIIVWNFEDEGLTIKNSELDHFYPRELYPYLAISLYNLVPSGKICNQGDCKHNKDTLVEGLKSPFELPDSEGFLFELVLDKGGITSYDTFSTSCGIETHVVYKDLYDNARVFRINLRYSTEMKQARRVWSLHKHCEAEGYQKMAAQKEKALGTTFTFDQWFESELDIIPHDYNKHKLSKLSMDIWRQLEKMRPVV